MKCQALFSVRRNLFAALVTDSLTFTPSLLRQQFPRNVKACFLGKIRKIFQNVGWGWSGGAKVSCFLCHQGVQLMLAYSTARPAILVAGKCRGEYFYFFCFFTFIPVPLSSLSLSIFSSTFSSISFFPYSGRRQKMAQWLAFH